MPLLQNPEAEDPRRIFAAGSSIAYAMEPAEVASKPYVNRILWTADGSTLLVRRLVPPAGAAPIAIAEARQTSGLEGMMKLRPRVQLVAWSRANRASRTVLDFDSARTTIGEIEPMPGTDRTLVLLLETPLLPDGTTAPAREAYVLLSVATGAAVRLWTASEPGEATTHIQLSRKRPLGAILRGTNDASRHTVAFFGPDGKVGPELPLAPRRRFGFTSDGLPGVVVYATDKKGKPSYSFFRLDPKTGAVGAPAVEDGYREGKSEEPPMQVGVEKPPKPNAGIYLHIKGGKPEELGLVSSEGTLPLLSPRNDAVAYLWGNGAYVRTLVKVDRKAYEASVLETERQRAMTAAKNVGLAMSMYAADADDAYPLNDQKASVGPYIRDLAMLESFVYTYAGGNPGGSGTTEIGYVAGPGGRAVVYADGSVKWVPDGF